MQVNIVNNLHGASLARKLTELLNGANKQNIIITPDPYTAQTLEKELLFFKPELKTVQFPDLDLLAYDQLSPHRSVISKRIACLSQLLNKQIDILFVSIKTLMSKLCPTEYFDRYHLVMHCGDEINLENFKKQCINAGYTIVNKVMESGECAFRGSLIDIFPTSVPHPLRIDLFDNEIESIKSFDEETQRSIESFDNIRLLPAHEFPTDDKSISLFRRQWRETFPGKPLLCPIYNEISDGIIPSGIEFYLPLFFDKTATFFNYLDDDANLYLINDVYQEATNHLQDIKSRYEQRSCDITRPILEVDKLFLPVEMLFSHIKNFNHFELNQEKKNKFNYSIKLNENLIIDRKKAEPLKPLKNYITHHNQKNILIIAESAGRKEVLLELFNDESIKVDLVESWQQFINEKPKLALIKGPLEQGCEYVDEPYIIITESQFFGETIIRQKRQKSFDPDVIIRSLTELRLHAPIVHIEHGVGRYKGLQTLTTNNKTNEFLLIEYAGESKIYVPVTSLHLISRYTGGSMEHAPLHRLGNDKWQKEKAKAEKKISDVAVELLDIYAEREAKKGFQFEKPNDDYYAFADDFPFQETEDQKQAINSIINDMCSIRPMDRLICGDVGFGKTEVAMRAAFLAIQSGKQICVLVPTTLLANQHYENFIDRFANFPVTIELLSRFRTKKDSDKVLEKLKLGSVDLVVGTHKLFSKKIEFKNLGLLIVDEEHRFGVKQKEHIKSIKKDVDILTLTATPIPRTLNMAMANIRDISIIATPPAKRLAIKTFCHEKSQIIIKEAIMREILRGGQVFFLHNEVETITHMANELSELVPEANIEIAHGQMRERQLETVMSEFYHHKFNVLVCSTIIENGIDIPTANTIIINRADKFGLAQLHQLRGRVGRGNNQAYAYLLTPDHKAISKDGQKRLEAILSLSDLGAGFTLATHDLEIRGAGELLGGEQSGHMHSLGFSLYMELLDRAVKDLRSGKTPELSKPLAQGPEINLSLSAIIPEKYMGDIHTRLIFYKRISNADSNEELKDLQVEMIDRFGLLPDTTKLLFNITNLKLKSLTLGICKINLKNDQLTIDFSDPTKIKPEIIIKLIQVHAARYKLKGSTKISVKINKENDIITETNLIMKELST